MHQESLVLHFISFLLKWQKTLLFANKPESPWLFEGLDRASSPTEQSYLCEERPKLVKFRLRLNKTPVRINSGFKTKQNKKQHLVTVQSHALEVSKLGDKEEENWSAVTYSGAGGVPAIWNMA